MRRRTAVLAGVATVLAAVAVATTVVVVRWRAARPPYPASAIAPTLYLREVTPANAAELPAEVAATDPGSGQRFAGTVSWRRPPSSRGRFAIYVVDRGTRLVPPTTWSDHQDQVSYVGGWPDDAVAARYPWLAGVDGVHHPDGSVTVSGERLDVPTDLTRVTFVAFVPKLRSDDQALYATSPIDVRDLTVGLAYYEWTDNDTRHLFWAVPLTAG